jgi:hypothetical protein
MAPFKDNEAEYSLLHGMEEVPLTEKPTQRRLKGIWLPNAILFVFSVICLVTSVCVSGFSRSTNFHLKQTNTYCKLIE